MCIHDHDPKSSETILKENLAGYHQVHPNAPLWGIWWHLTRYRYNFVTPHGPRSVLNSRGILGPFEPHELYPTPFLLKICRNYIGRGSLQTLLLDQWKCHPALCLTHNALSHVANILCQIHLICHIRQNWTFFANFFQNIPFRVDQPDKMHHWHCHLSCRQSWKKIILQKRDFTICNDGEYGIQGHCGHQAAI